ncbi:MAG: VanZ family protein [Oscillospiraceae bacterium]|nr:VanZ family protein [Oscillospiraceae bacterium]
MLFFIPFGFWFPKRVISPSVFQHKRWLLILSAGMLFSVLIETTQYLTCRGLCELDDVLCNGLGSLIGYRLFIALRSVWKNTQKL